MKYPYSLSCFFKLLCNNIIFILSLSLRYKHKGSHCSGITYQKIYFSGFMIKFIKREEIKINSTVISNFKDRPY